MKTVYDSVSNLLQDHSLESVIIALLEACKTTVKTLEREKGITVHSLEYHAAATQLQLLKSTLYTPINPNKRATLPAIKGGF